VVGPSNARLVERLRAADQNGVSEVDAGNRVIFGSLGFAAHGCNAIREYWSGFRGVASWQLDVLAIDGGEGTIWQEGRSMLVMDSGTGPMNPAVKWCGGWRRDDCAECRSTSQANPPHRFAKRWDSRHAPGH